MGKLVINHEKITPSKAEALAKICPFGAISYTDPSAVNQIYPILGDKVVGDIVAADIKNLLNHWMSKGLSFSTVKKAYVLLNEYFRTMYLEAMISKNPMDNVEMIKKQTSCRHRARSFCLNVKQ